MNTINVTIDTNIFDEYPIFYCLASTRLSLLPHLHFNSILYVFLDHSSCKLEDILGFWQINWYELV